MNPGGEKLASHRGKFCFGVWNITTGHRVSKGIRVDSKSGYRAANLS